MRRRSLHISHKVFIQIFALVNLFFMTKLTISKEGTAIKLKKVKNENDNSNFLLEIQEHLGNNKYHSFILQHQSEYKGVFLQTLSSKMRKNVSSEGVKVIPMKNFKNSEFVGNIQIGIPSQNIPVIFDTGSGNLWLTSSKCDSPSCKTKISYNREKSSMFHKLGLPVQVTFGTGEVSGEINSDTFKLSDITIDSQRFAEIFSEKGDVFYTTEFSGILGLAYPSLTAYDSTPAFDTVIKQKLLKKNLISFYFSQSEEKDGEVGFGYINSKLYDGKLHYFNVIDKYYWTIGLEDIMHNGVSLNLCPKGCKAIADTGTTLITGPTSDVRKLLKSIPVENNCSNLAAAGKLEFVFSGGIKFTLDVEDYISISKDKKTCSAMVMPLDVPGQRGANAWVLGITFLTKYYSVYDRDTDQVGFALARHSEPKVNYEN